MEKSLENGPSDPEEASPDNGSDVVQASSPTLAEPGQKGRWERSWPTIACGAGLFSDGYIQSVIGSVNTILTQIYGDQFTHSPQRKNVNAIAFAGTVVGQLVFGVLSDYWSRKNSLLISTLILIIFSALSASAYGAGGTLGGMLAALTAYRFLVGVGVGGEHPAGSVGAAEFSNEFKRGHRNRWFILFTNVQFDLGFVSSTLVPMILVLIFTDNHLRAAWRVALGLGVIPPLSLVWLRFKLQEPEEYNHHRMHQYPYLLIIKFYGFRLLLVSFVWFVYDFLTYSFSIYSSAWLDLILGDIYPLWVSLGWSTLINAFYVPGAVIGAFASDWFGPKHALAAGVAFQGIIGFFMAAFYGHLNTPSHVAGFVAIYGLFLAAGEIGAGDNIGLVASKTCATAIRGQYYSVAAALGKAGGFVGTYVFPSIQAAAGADATRAGQYPFYVSSSLCILSAAVALFLLPHIGQDIIGHEDERFRAYLQQNGFDTSTMGSKGGRRRRGASPTPREGDVDPSTDP